MKLVKKKTRKAIDKGVRKAFKKHGPAVMAVVAGSLVTSIATMAASDAAGNPGTSNLMDLVDRARKSVAGRDAKKGHGRKAHPDSADVSPDEEDGHITERPSLIG